MIILVFKYLPRNLYRAFEIQITRLTTGKFHLIIYFFILFQVWRGEIFIITKQIYQCGMYTLIS